MGASGTPPSFPGTISFGEKWKNTVGVSGRRGHSRPSMMASASKLFHHQCCHPVGRKPWLFILSGTQFLDMHGNDYRAKEKREKTLGKLFFPFLSLRGPFLSESPYASKVREELCFGTLSIKVVSAKAPQLPQGMGAGKHRNPQGPPHL